MKKLLAAVGLVLLVAGCSPQPDRQEATPDIPRPIPTVTATVTIPIDPQEPLTNLDAYAICRTVGDQNFQVSTDPDESWQPYEEAHFDSLPDGRTGVYSVFRFPGQEQSAASYCVVSGTKSQPFVDFTTVMSDLSPEIGLNRYNLFLRCQADSNQCP